MSRNYYRHLIEATAPAPTGLFANAVAYYKLDETSGQAIDVVNGYNGVLHGGVTQGVAGKIGSAYSFDGVDDYLEINNQSDFIISNDGINDNAFTISFWVWLDSFSSSGIWLLNKRDTVSDWEYQLVLFEGDLIFSIQDNSNVFIMNGDYNSNISLNTWNHIVVTYDGNKSEQGINLYLNNQLKKDNNRNNSYSGACVDRGNNLVLGARGWNRTLGLLDGKLDEACIIKNKAWTPAQVAADYNNGQGTTITI